MPGQPHSLDDLVQLIRRGDLFGAGTVLEGQQGIGLIGERSGEWAEPDFVTVMHSESAVQEYQGIAGFREALTDWMTPYERFRLAIDEVIVKDDKLIFLVRQLARTKHQRCGDRDTERRRLVDPRTAGSARLSSTSTAGRAEGGRDRSRPPV